MTARSRAFALAIVLCAAATASAQTFGRVARSAAAAPAPNAFVELAPDEPITPVERTRADEVLRGRQKAPMHPADEPLRLVGIEEGDPTLRDGTPALARAAGSAALVDVEALRLRTIAMVSERQTFHQAPKSSGERTTTSETQRRAAQSKKHASLSEKVTSSSSASTWTWIGALVGATLLAFLAVRRTMSGAA